MAKLARTTHKVFGLAGITTNFGKFGSAKAGTPVITKTIPTIMALSAWDNGWQDALVTTAEGDAPCLEEENALDYVHSFQVGYLMQEGIPEWDSGTNYWKNSIVKLPLTIGGSDGAPQLFASLLDNNLGNTPPVGASNAQWAWINPPPVAATHGIQKFAASVASWPVPANVYSVNIKVWGAGGGGGGGSQVGSDYVGSGGNGGGYSEAQVAVSPGDLLAVVVGIGGTGGAGGGTSVDGSPGLDGAESSVTNAGMTIIARATGGQGGWGGSASNFYRYNKLPGNGIVGDITVYGQQVTNLNSTGSEWGSQGGQGGQGGAGGYAGYNAIGATGAHAGGPGVVPGGGGGGGGCDTNGSYSPATNGGSGANGLVVISW